ncbi:MULTISPECIES: MFS transporter [Cellulophaga]|uniref:Major facilitator superfamily MFS_1 n=2 Tax=Cellulophaga TaxID=104264 RepID=F0RHH8_CELLC|nr:MULTISPECIES: MFS transporter [Cellulophaga]ADY30244.1 major facilitator superfamily MFS_1 [Cellulophaga lytica DSM 7489]AIM61236.1 major facilitator transporter [Cellulophaga lytica]APU11124.1 MFS transporter [Cellulophaga lytica]TVZ10445.1 maltose/moltooligosaccharide transporter [Cellulophaga sp. RHA_52]WQG78821.1 MFS transporter [Cellulophaga lytica]
MEKQKLGFWQIWNMSFGFLGIQFGFALQGGFMSRIFQTLGAEKDAIPLLWIAAPLTGLVVQPIIGYLSDRTWSARWGRRKPYFLIGAILSSLALFLVPHSPVLWIAAGFLWILDASINVSMEPFRALVADKLPDSQRSYGFVIQTLIIGIGTWVASNLPWMVSKLGVSDAAPSGVVPMSVKVAFAIGAVVFLISILYTIFTTSEYPPEDMEEFKREKAKKNQFISDIINNIGNMPSTMKKLGVIQFFSWFAFFTMWSMANPALTEHVFNTPAPVEANYNMEIAEDLLAFNTTNEAFQKSSNLVGSYMGTYGLSSMAFALILVLYTSRKRINRKIVHMCSLIIGGVGFLLMYFIPSPEYLTLCFILIGFAWGSILSMPYAMLSSAVDPKRMGVFMGIFNMFIVIPQIIAAIGGINIISNLLGEGAINAMIIAGISLIIAGLCNFLITEKSAISYQTIEE